MVGIWTTERSVCDSTSPFFIGMSREMDGESERLYIRPDFVGKCSVMVTFRLQEQHSMQTSFRKI